MIAGHAPLAFALCAYAADRLVIDRRRALLLGIAAGAFAVVPDVDMTYAVVGLLGSDVSGAAGAITAFWAHSTVVHRAMTHSLVIAVPAAAAFSLAVGDRRSRSVAAGLIAALVLVTAVVAGPLGGAMMALYTIAGVTVALAASRHGLGTRDLLVAALFGLGSHPFGDLFTGTPPRLLYPLDVRLLTERITLLPDPTLNLLSVFGLEIAAIWLAAAVAAGLLGRSLVEFVNWRAAAGASYGAAALLLPTPTLDASYRFVFSVLAVGAVGITPALGRPDRGTLARASVTGLAAVTIGGLAYTAVYLLA